MSPMTRWAGLAIAATLLACGGGEAEEPPPDVAVTVTDTGGSEPDDAGGAGCPAGECPVICTPGLPLGECATPNEYLVCNASGTGGVGFDCEAGLSCYKGTCLKLVCEPSSIACLAFTAVRRCKDDGSGWDVVEECQKGGVCTDGKCLTACEVDIKSATYVGCEYYAADLDNVEGGQYEPLAVVVSIPSGSSDATVTITDMGTGTTLTPAELGVSDTSAAAGELKVFVLPGGMDIDGSGKARRSFRIETTTPATVHQFNPLNGEGVFTQDASLLLPTHVLGSRYFAMSWPHRDDSEHTLRGFVAVVAVEPGPTHVTLVPRAAVVGGGPDSGVAPISEGATATFVLEQGEVLNLETGGKHGSDLTGTLIEADRKIAVFGGHECGNVPLGVSACDHLEQQLPPVAAWGSTVVAAPFAARSPAQVDVWRIVGGAPDVLVTTDPPQPGYGAFTLHEGTSATFTSAEAFVVQASGPILVGHFMTGSAHPGFVKACGHTGIGDPAFTLAPPAQQFLAEYTVLTPPGYAESYVNVVARPDAAVTVDGTVVSGLTPVADGAWAVARHPVGPGVHTVTGDSKLGLTAYGYDCDVSYAYPGGLRLQALSGGGEP